MRSKHKTHRFKGLIDTTLRDGQQSPLLFDRRKYYFTLSEKKKLIEGLIQLGVTHLEFFSPVVSRQERSEFVALKKYIESLATQKIMLLAHCRCQEDDIEQAVDAGFDGVNLYMNGTRAAQQYNYRRTRTEIVEHVRKIVSQTRERYPALYIRFSVEDAFRTATRDICRFFDGIYEYVNTFGIPDTVGVATPQLVRARVRTLLKKYPKVDLECHFHNDQGYALINTMTAIEVGVAYVDTAIWGLAERSGIASTTGVLLNLDEISPDYTKDYNLELCYPLNILMGSILNMHVPYNEPVSVTNRTHIAGVHQKAVLNHARIYEAHRLDRFGVTKNQLMLGPLSGWNVIYYYLREFKNYDLTKDDARAVASDFKKDARRMNGEVRAEELLEEIVKRHRIAKLRVPSHLPMERVENLS